MFLTLGAILGAIVGLLLAHVQVVLLQRYARGKEPHIVERVQIAIMQLRMGSYLSFPMIFAIVGYTLAGMYWPN